MQAPGSLSVVQRHSFESTNMKLTICLLAVLAALCIASAHARQQAPPFNESLAYARLIAAHKLPTVTHGQCFSAQGDWLERDKVDKQNGPYWSQRKSLLEWRASHRLVQRKRERLTQPQPLPLSAVSSHGLPSFTGKCFTGRKPFYTIMRSSNNISCSPEQSG